MGQQTRRARPLPVGLSGRSLATFKSAAAALLPAIESGALTFLDRGSERPAGANSRRRSRDVAGELHGAPRRPADDADRSQHVRLCPGVESEPSVLRGHRNSNFGTSPHSANGGGRAVDDYSGFGGRATTGADANAIKYLNAVAPFAPPDGNVLGFGQANCRAGAGTSVSLPGIRQFKDFCNHVHVDFGNTGDGQLKGR